MAPLRVRLDTALNACHLCRARVQLRLDVPGREGHGRFLLLASLPHHLPYPHRLPCLA